MNTFFVNITESLNLKKDDDSSLNPLDSENINDILEKHKHHPSVHKISQTFMTNEKFFFQFVTEGQVREEIMILDGDISIDILKSTVDIHLPFITNSINLSIALLKLTQSLKRKMTETKRSTDLSVFYRTCQRSLKKSCIIK